MEWRLFFTPFLVVTIHMIDVRYVYKIEVKNKNLL